MDISRTLVELNPDGVLGYDREFRFNIWNPAMERMTGMGREAVIGRNAFEVFPFLREIGEDAHLAAALDGTVSVSRDRAYRILQTGHIGFFEGHYLPLHDDSGVVVGALGLIRDVTGRRKAEALVRESRELFESYMAHIPGVAFMKDSDGRHVYANRAYEETHGLKPHEWEGKLDTEIFPPETAARFREGDLEVLRAGAPLRMVDHQGARAEPEDWMWVKFPFSDASGRRLVAGLAFNITEQYRAAQALAVSEARFRAVLEQAPFSVQIVRPDGSVALANPAFETLWGVSRDVLHGYNLLEDPQIEALGVLPHMKRAFGGEVVALPPLYYDPALNGRPGRARWTEATFYPVRDEAGNVRELVLMHRDITERVQIEREREYVHTISDAALSHLNMEEVPEVAASRLREILQVDAAAVLMKMDSPSFIVRSAAGAEELVGTQVAAAEDAKSLLCAAGFTGCAAVPLEIAGTPVGIVAVGRREREMSPEDMRLLRALADRVALVIAHAQLFTELHDANRRKDEFLATLGHELRNPLAPLLVAAELIRVHGAADPVLCQAQEVVARQAQQMRRLVDDLLDVARITRGIVSLRLEPVDLREAVREAIRTARPLIDAREHDLSVSMPSKPVHVEADRLRIEQVITNLLSNASKFTPHRGRIGVRLAVSADAAAITIEDSGKGIPRDMLPRVFDLFTQVNPSLDRAEGGLGLGLTLVKRLVEMHGGSVTATSAGEGLGTAFVIHLPVRRAPQRVPLDAAEIESPAAVESCRVLVVDDNVDSAEMLALMLPVWGYRTRMAHTGPEALDEFARFDPDIVLLDIGLPGMSGYEVASRLHADPERRRVPLVALTGYGQEEDRRRTQEAGFAAHLTKPVDMEVLRAVLSSLRPGSV